MSAESWIAIATPLAIIVASVLPWALNRWLPSSPRSSTPTLNPTITAAHSHMQWDIRRNLIWPAWTACIASAGMLVWNVAGAEPVGRSDVLLIVLYSLLFLVTLGFVAFAHVLSAIASIVDRYEKPKT